MEKAVSRDGLWKFTTDWKRRDCRVALVPTMGNLHAGHLALLRHARERADRTVVSIFVNPTQFGPGEDFAAYPRTLEADLQVLESNGCDLAFVPTDTCVYPNGIAGAVRVTASPSLSSILEGRNRPGHFDGVVTVVARLFNLVGPDLAVFGEKDFQQLLVIRHMTADLGYPVAIESVPTVREESGLARSSRNRYLDEEQRAAACGLSAALQQAVRMLAQGADRGRVERAGTQRLAQHGLEVDYFVVRRAADLAVPEPGDAPLRVLAAARCGRTRLIDNMAAD
ncbi:MAG: pantoate--beta-alanine ligase [Lysobacterales bacterium]|jgi:pantoate--beta-alanine ligase